MAGTSDSKVRYAVVGLGWFGQVAVLPAFKHARKNSELAALVSGDAEKREELSKKYAVPAFSYEEYDRLLESGRVDAVYLVLPNSMHHDFTLRAARRGIHVLCEKPLAGSAAEAKEMVDACRNGNVRLMTAYRLHFDDANLGVIELLKEGKIGEPRLFHAIHTNNMTEENSRLEGELAGGPLRDVGIYCLNAARYLFQDEPTEVVGVTASKDDPRFAEVPEMVSAILRFPGERIATFSCGFGESSVSEFQVVGTEGDVRLEKGFSFNSVMKRVLTINGKSRTKSYPITDQVAPEILHFSECVQDGKDPEPSGLEGLIDMEIMEAIEESYRTGQRVMLDLPKHDPKPNRSQEMDRPPVSEPSMVNAESPKS